MPMKVPYLVLCALVVLAACSTGGEHGSTRGESPEDVPTPRTTGPRGERILIGHPAAEPPRKLSSFAPIPGGKAGLLTVVDTPYEIFEDQGTYVHVAAWRLS